MPVREGRSTALKAHTGTVRCVNFSADGKLLITCGDDKTVKVGQLSLSLHAVTQMQGAIHMHKVELPSAHSLSQSYTSLTDAESISMLKVKNNADSATKRGTS